MKVKFKKDHLEYRKDEVIEIESSERANYFERMGVAEIVKPKKKRSVNNKNPITKKPINKVATKKNKPRKKS